MSISINDTTALYDLTSKTHCGSEEACTPQPDDGVCFMTDADLIYLGMSLLGYFEQCPSIQVKYMTITTVLNKSCVIKVHVRPIETLLIVEFHNLTRDDSFEQVVCEAVAYLSECGCHLWNL